MDGLRTYSVEIDLTPGEDDEEGWLDHAVKAARSMLLSAVRQDGFTGDITHFVESTDAKVFSIKVSF